MIWQRWRRRWRECDHSRIIIIVRRIEPVVYEICTGLRVAATRNDCVRIERSLGNAVPMHPGNQQQMLPRVYVFSPIVVFDFHTGFMASFLFLRFSLSPSLSLSLSLSLYAGLNCRRCWNSPVCGFAGGLLFFVIDLLTLATSFTVLNSFSFELRETS